MNKTLPLALAALLLVGRDAAAQCPVTLNAPTQVYWFSENNEAYLTGAPYGSSTTWTVTNGTITYTSPDQTLIRFRVTEVSPVIIQATNQCSMARSVENVQPPYDCAVTLDKPRLTATAPPSSQTLNVTAGCTWSLYALPAWMTAPGGTTGNGNSAITLNFAANPGSAPRTATLVINDKLVPVAQQGTHFHGPDFNADGKTDLLWRNTSNGMVFASFVQNGVTAGGSILAGEPDQDWRITATGDAAGDDYSDILWRKESNGAFYLQFVTASGIVAGPGGGAYGAHAVGSGPVSASDRNVFDFLTRRPDGQLTILRRDGSDPEYLRDDSGPPLWTEPDPNWKVIGVDDFDGNGTADILLRHAVGGTCFIILTKPAYAYVLGSGVYHYEPDLAWQLVDTGDLNGDGRADMIWRHTDGRVWVQLMDGLTPVGSGLVWNEPDPNWVIKGTGDFNGDGKADILWRNASTGIVFATLMDGTTVVSSTVVHREPDPAWALVAPSTSAAIEQGNP